MTAEVTAQRSWFERATTALAWFSLGVWVVAALVAAGDTPPDAAAQAVGAASVWRVAPVVTFIPSEGGDQETRKPGIPTGIVIPVLNVRAPVIPVGVTVGEDWVSLDVPHDIDTVGWYDATVKPGSAEGTSLLSGHLDDADGNTGALHELVTLAVGDTIVVTSTKGDVTYRVATVNEYPKASLSDVLTLAVDGPPRIAVVTCGGPLVRGQDGLRHYRDNTVVLADLVTR